jgi:hypothetical protein
MGWRYQLAEVESCALNLANFKNSRERYLNYTAEAACSVTGIDLTLGVFGGNSVISCLAFSIIVVTKSNANIELIQLSKTFNSPSSSITLPGSSKFGYLSPVNRVSFVQWVTAFDSSNL